MITSFNFGDPITGWNNKATPTSFGIETLIANMNDSLGSPTGISLSSLTSGALLNINDTRASTDHHSLDIEFWRGIGYVTSGTLTLQLAGLTSRIGESYSITIAGYSKSTTERVASYDVDGGVAQQYTSTTAEPPNAPIVLTGTVTADTLNINATLVTGLAIINGFSIEFTAGGAAITTVDDPVTAGANAHTVSDFGSTVNQGGISGSTASVIFTSANDTASTIPVPVDTQDAVPYGPVTYELGDGTDTATIATNYTTEAGFAYVELASGFDTGSNSFLSGYGGTPAIGDQFRYDPTSLTLNSDGSWSATSSGVYDVLAVDVSDVQPVYEGFTITVGPTNVRYYRPFPWSVRKIINE